MGGGGGGPGPMLPPHREDAASSNVCTLTDSPGAPPDFTLARANGSALGVELVV